MPFTFHPFEMAALVTALMQAFIPGASPPEVSTPMHVISFILLSFCKPFLPQKLCLSVISKLTVSLPQRRLESDAERCSCATVVAGTGATPAAFYLGLCRLRGIQSPSAPHDCAAGGLILSVATTNPAVIPKSGPEIKNRCTQEGLNMQKPAAIPKLTP